MDDADQRPFVQEVSNEVAILVAPAARALARASTKLAGIVMIFGARKTRVMMFREFLTNPADVDTRCPRAAHTHADVHSAKSKSPVLN